MENGSQRINRKVEIRHDETGAETESCSAQKPVPTEK
jgi:hypothetical protein